MTIHSKLEKAIQNDNLVIFIGSGFSKDLGFLDWKGLAKKIIEEIAIDDTKLSTLIPVIENDILTPIEVLEKVKNKKREIREALEKSFTLSRDQIIQIKENEKYKLLWEVSNKIITTNYDRALEKSNDEIDDALVHFNDPYGLSKLSNSKGFYLKIHGCISNPTTCILLEEEYEKLYSDTLVKHEFKKIISDKTILFLGFSLSDPYVIRLMESIKKIYEGYGRTHFLVSTNNDDFSDYGVTNISLDSWDDLNPFLKTLIEKKKIVKQINIKENIPVEEEEKKTKSVRIAVFKANPIDRKLEYNNEISEIKKRNCQVDYFPLTIDNLHNHCDYDYYFILSEEIKGKILIESEVLTSKLITLSEFEDNLCSSRLKGIILILKNLNELEVDQKLIKSYLFLNRVKKDRLNSIFFKLFKKLDYKFLLNSGFKMINEDQFTLLEINENSIHNEIKSSYISDSIDKNNLQNFIGRKTDLIEITKKLLESRENGKALIIKGSGGIGKTTLIKKAALELSIRNLFKEGIYFVDCEFINSYSEFEKEVAKTFNLEQEVDFFEYLKKYIKNKNKMIIIDNFETLNSLAEIDQIKKLLSKIADYSVIAVTSRETITLGFEDLYEIRSFTTDEAEEFFIQESNNNMVIHNQKDKRNLREEILESILGNNPLAVQLIAKNVDKGTTIESLKSDLEKDLSVINDNFNFDIDFQESDRNIEKRKTLASSIYYSYKTLKENEKFIFEILSLFPNGIHIENLRGILNNKFDKEDSLFRISIKEINALGKKSLIENNNGNIRLQSIIGRFAEHQFKKRENTSQYFKEVYKYNSFILRISNEDTLKENQKNKIIESNHRNLLKVLKFIEEINIDNSKRIYYVYLLVSQLSFLNNFDEIIKSLNSVKKIFEVSKIEKNFYKALNLYFRYFNGEFSESYNELKKSFPINEIVNYDLKNFLLRHTLKKVLTIYDMEGLESHEIKLLPLSKEMTKMDYAPILFRMGEYDYNNKIKLDATDNYLSWDMKYNLGFLNENTIENHLNSLHEKDLLDIIQVNYIKAKMNLTSKEEIQKLIVVNPYTKGLKMLMYAFLEEGNENKKKLYENALKHLKHIKYYYIEALYYYSSFLKNSGSNDEYERILSKGIELSKKYNYRFLFHNLLCLKNEMKKEYILDDYSFKDKDINYFLKFAKGLK